MLTERFVENESHAVGKIERTKVFAHGNAQGIVRILRNQRFGQSFGFFAEEQKTTVWVGNVGIPFFRFGRKIIKSAARVFAKEIIERIVFGYVQFVPIIEPRAFNGAVAPFESVRAHKVQVGVGAGARARNVAGVLRYFRLYQNYV